MSNTWKRFISGALGPVLLLGGAMLVLTTIFIAVETCAVYSLWLGVPMFLLVPVEFGLLFVAIDALLNI